MVVLFLALGASLLTNFALIGATAGSLGAGVDDHTVRTTVLRGASDQKIAVLPIEGVINDAMAAQVSRWLDAVERDSNVRAVILAVDTPGGTVTASDVIHSRILRLKEARSIPVVVSMGGLATSGGYYVSAAADHIVAQPTTLTGNIGVLMPRYNVSELAKKWGVSENTLTAPPDGFKNAGSMFQPENEKEKAYLQSLINGMYQRFRNVVVTGRSGKLKGNVDDICNGQVFLAGEAVKRGLVDAEGYFEQAVQTAQQMAGLNKPTVVRYQRRLSFFEAMTGGAASNLAPAGRGDGALNLSVRVDRDALTEWTSPRPMYLWRGQ